MKTTKTAKTAKTAKTDSAIRFAGKSYPLKTTTSEHGMVSLQFADWRHSGGALGLAMLHRIAAEALMEQAKGAGGAAFAYVDQGAVHIETLNGSEAEITAARNLLMRAARAVK